MDGILLINKPPRLTSFDVVQRVRRISGIKKVGHFGTLDPLATGLILVGLGKATRFFSFYAKLDKAYRGQIRLGFSTDTYDADGTPTMLENDEFPSEDKLLEHMAALVGEIEQTPPRFSAKKFKGTPFYVLARKNEDARPTPVTIQVRHFRLLGYDPPYIKFDVSCSSGTYIRSLAHDLGQSLQCGAHLSQLERTAIGSFRIQESTTLDDLEKFAQEDRLGDILIPLESALPELPNVILNDAGVVLTKNGNMIFPKHIRTPFPVSFDLSDAQGESFKICKLFDPEGRLLALGKFKDKNDGIHPFLVIDSKTSGV